MNPMISKQYQSFGRYPSVMQKSQPIYSRFDALPTLTLGHKVIPRGLGRSYGDVCLNDQETILLTEKLDHFISFDPHTGLMCCESGVTFAEILELVVPQGFFLPVTPGTKFVTVGGAIANDVHGKNHHTAGSFGHHVTQFELLRSDGSRLLCSPTQNAEYFMATIGGLGLTGLVTWAEFQLIPIFSDLISQEVIRFGGLSEFYDISNESERDFMYTVAWIDCLAKGKNLGRGLFMRGNHVNDAALKIKHSQNVKGAKFNIPCDAPHFVLNPASISLFNWAYYWKQRRKSVASLTHYNPFFYPLDAIENWNRLYGKRGFLQYQCVVPPLVEEAATREMLTVIAKARMGSFLVVLKRFGDRPSRGMLSFSRPGTTLALDFPNVGPRLFELLNHLDSIVRSAHGAVYPAKDARMSREAFTEFYPRVVEFKQYMDPQFSSSFWRRVGE